MSLNQDYDYYILWHNQDMMAYIVSYFVHTKATESQRFICYRLVAVCSLFSDCLNETNLLIRVELTLS